MEDPYIFQVVDDPLTAAKVSQSHRLQVSRPDSMSSGSRTIVVSITRRKQQLKKVDDCWEKKDKVKVDRISKLILRNASILTMIPPTRMRILHLKNGIQNCRLRVPWFDETPFADPPKSQNMMKRMTWKTLQDRDSRIPLDVRRRLKAHQARRRPMRILPIAGTLQVLLLTLSRMQRNRFWTEIWE